MYCESRGRALGLEVRVDSGYDPLNGWWLQPVKWVSI